MKDIKAPLDFEGRKQVVAVMEAMINNYARIDVMNVIGFTERKEARAIVSQLRFGMDQVSYHYLSHGADILPAIESAIPPRVRWLFVMFYIVYSRCRFDSTYTRHIAGKINGSRNFSGIANTLRVLVTNPTAWKDPESLVRAIVLDLDMPYQPSVVFDGRDVLAMANLFGFNAVNLFSAKGFKFPDFSENELDDLDTQLLSPDVTMNFSKPEKKLLVKTLFHNRRNLMSDATSFVVLPATQTRVTKTMRSLLASFGNIPHEPNEDLDAIINQFVSTARRMSFEPIPRKADQEMINIFRDRLNLDIGLLTAIGDHSRDASTVFYAYLMAISMGPAEQISTLN